MADNDKNVGAILDVIILFVFKTSSFNSQNSQYLDIFGFIRIDFMCFSNKGFREIYSVIHKKGRFYYADNS